MDSGIDKRLLLGHAGGAHEKDNLLDGFTYEEVIIAVCCNEPVIDEEAVRRTVNNIVMQNMKDMKALLATNMAKIIELANENRGE